MAIAGGEEVGAIEQRIEDERGRFQVPGTAVAMVREGEVVLARGFGFKDHEGRSPVTERTKFAIASVTKAFTATLIAALVGDGRLEWDRPVREYLPRLRMYDPVATELMTPKDLLCHRSGLPRHDLLWYANPHLSRREVVEERLRHLEPSLSFREGWQYNNLMYLTAGYLAGQVMSTTWEEAVTTRLLVPLGMTATCFSPEEARQTGDWSQGYRETRGRLVPQELKDMPVCGPAGSIYSCVADLAEWVRVNVNDGRRGDVQVIEPAALRTLHAPAMVIPEVEELWPEKFAVGYALGWQVESYRGSRLIEHSGGIDGFSSMVMMAPGARCGVAVLSNKSGTSLPVALAYTLMDDLLGLSPLPWGERFQGVELALRQGMEQAIDHRQASARPAPPTQELRAYEGDYHHPGYGRVTVTVADGGLGVYYGEFEMTVAHRHHDTWDATVPSVSEVAIPVTFQTDADGEVASLSMPLEPSIDPIEFLREPDARLSDATFLDTLTGDYEMGPLRARIERRASQLTVHIPGAVSMELVPHRRTTFRVRGRPGLSMEFVLSDGGGVKEVVVQPVGVFTPASRT
ncbi:MAG: serine hydrolase [Candidatus Dormibacteraeota bacterium]|nr:serine hydrolase [Candidatus Dormibacteraeota bacterium]